MEVCPKEPFSGLQRGKGEPTPATSPAAAPGAICITTSTSDPCSSESRMSWAEWRTYPKDEVGWLGPTLQELLGFAQTPYFLYRSQTPFSLACYISLEEQFCSNARLQVYILPQASHCWIPFGTWNFFLVPHLWETTRSLMAPQGYERRGVAGWLLSLSLLALITGAHLALGKRNSSMWPQISSFLWGSASPSRNQQKKMRYWKKKNKTTTNPCEAAVISTDFHKSNLSGKWHSADVNRFWLSTHRVRNTLVLTRRVVGGRHGKLATDYCKKPLSCGLYHSRATVNNCK